MSSWFGGHISTLTEKLTEITKDVLTDSGSNESGEGSLQQSDSHSPQELLDLCRNKDGQIKLLMKEKESLEKNIEELDLQHQEAVEELLHLKNEATKENTQLREELALERENSIARSLFRNFQHNLQMEENFDNTEPLSRDFISNSMKTINLVNIFGVMWKNYNEDTLNMFVNWLKEQRNLLECQNLNSGDGYPRIVVNRINGYIRFLDQLSENPEIFSPIIDEIAAVIHFLLSNTNDLASVPNNVNRQSNEYVQSSAATNSETSDFSSQATLPDFRHVQNLFSATPEPFICDNSASGDGTSGGCFSSHYAQTDDENSVQDCKTIIFDLKHFIYFLEQEKNDLEEQVSYFEGQVSFLEERVRSLSVPASTSSELIQTDEYECDCITPTIQELDQYISVLEQEKSELQKDVILLKSASEISTLSNSVQTDEHSCECNTPKVYELETCINILQQEKSDLEEKISQMQEVSNQFLPVSIQTDKYECSCNTYELEANICILEQDKADLQDEILRLEDLLSKETSSIHIQTDDEFCPYDALQSEITGLKETLCTNEKIHNENLFQMIKNLSELEEELKVKENCICEKDNIICVLKCQLEEYENKINDFSENVPSKESAALEIMDGFYEQKILHLMESLEEKERNYKDYQNLMIDTINDLKEEINFKQSSIDGNESLIQSLKCELKEYKKDVHDLNGKCMNSVDVQTDEKCSCELYQQKISELKKAIEEREKENDSTQEQVISSINGLKKELNLKEILINEKDELIESLKCDLQEFENCKLLLNVLKDQLNLKEISNNEKNSIIQTLKYDLQGYENCEIQLKNLNEQFNRKNKLIDDKDHIIQSLNYELQASEDSKTQLKEELNVKDTLNSEKEDAIQKLKFYLQDYETSNVQLKEELNKKETAISENYDIIQKLTCDLQDYETSMEQLREELNMKETMISENCDIIQKLNCDLQDYETSMVQLREELNMKETMISENCDIIQKLKCNLQGYETNKVQLENLKEQLTKKETIINAKDDKIQSLKSTLQAHESNVKHLPAEVQPDKLLTSVEIQTNENECMCELYRSEISKLKKTIEEKEEEFSIFQNQITDNCSDLKKELNSKISLIADKDALLYSLNHDLDKCKREMKCISDELQTLTLSSSASSNIYSCSCKKYESELADLKMYIDEKEKIFNATQNDLVNNLDNLKEVYQSKESLIIEKEIMIQTLKEELEEAKRNIKMHFSELSLKPKHDYAKDIDTTEECDIKMFVQNCNKCKNILNGESNENDFKNEVKSLQEKLKALDLDKNQLLCVLNEKSQECSTLKAEVHKLTSIVASEKQALFKLQQDNCALKESRDNTDPELTKEAIKKLSQIIRDKDLEIESLRQKNNTLTALIQDGTSVPDHMQSLMEEKENLSKQINMLKADRDKIMVRYNAIDKDCRQYSVEVKKLKSALSDEKEKFDVLEQKHFSVAQQYEEKQKSLINTQNEMIALKQRVSDLEEQQVDIKEKYGELLNKFNSDNMVQLTKSELEEKNAQIEQLISSNSEKDHLIQEKDCLIHDLSQQVKTLKSEYEQQQSNLSIIQSKVDELSSKLKEQEASVERLQTEKEALDLRFQDKNSELGLLKEMNDRLNMNLKEKEFTIQSMTDKISSLSHYISSDHTTSDTVDINQILADSESMFSKAQSLYKERDETLLALSQSKQENQSLRNEIQRMKSSEIHLKKELERLRMHLLEIEENYTAEALKSENREKELRDELVEMKRRADISNSAIVDTNQRASIQIVSLQEQLSMIANQRDQALAQVSTLEDKVHQQSASVSKLQLVLEQMQRGNERKIKETEKKLTVLLENQKELCKELEEKLQAKEMQLVESSHALEAASRLSEQLDAKEEVITNLKTELAETESKIKSTAQEIDTIKSNTEGKVDRVVMKSLVLGYFSTPTGQKSEVIRLLARVLDFNQEEMERAGIVVGRSVARNEQKGLFSSIFNRLPSLSTEKTQPTQEKSFSSLFVQFLENESQPFVPMPFPAEKMSPELPFKQPSAKKSPTGQRKSLSRNNPLLLDIDSAFPTFTPVPAVEYSQSPAPSILREVLE